MKPWEQYGSSAVKKEPKKPWESYGGTTVAETPLAVEQPVPVEEKEPAFSVPSVSAWGGGDPSMGDTGGIDLQATAQDVLVDTPKQIIPGVVRGVERAGSAVGSVIEAGGDFLDAQQRQWKSIYHNSPIGKRVLEKRRKKHFENGGTTEPTLKAGKETAGDKVASIGEEVHDFWEEAANTGWEKRDEEIYSGTFSENPSLARLAGGASESAPTMLAALGLSYAGMPNAGAILLAGSEAAPIYTEAKRLGVDEKEAFSYALLSGIGTAALERVGLDALTGKNPMVDALIEKMGKNWVAGAMVNFATEGTQEALQTIYQNAVATGYDGDRALLDGALEAGLVGGLMGSGAGASRQIISDYMSKQAVASKDAVDSQPEPVEQDPSNPNNVTTPEGVPVTINSENEPLDDNGQPISSANPENDALRSTATGEADIISPEQAEAQSNTKPEEAPVDEAVEPVQPISTPESIADDMIERDTKPESGDAYIKYEQIGRLIETSDRLRPSDAQQIGKVFRAVRLGHVTRVDFDKFVNDTRKALGIEVKESDQVPAKPVVKTDQAPSADKKPQKGMTVEESKAYLEGRGLETLVPGGMDTINDMQQGRHKAQPLPPPEQPSAKPKDEKAVSSSSADTTTTQGASVQGGDSISDSPNAKNESQSDLSSTDDTQTHPLKSRNTRGGSERFHGTSSKINSVDEYTYSPMNIYGQGFYSTDAVDVGVGYMKKGKGKERTLYKVDESRDDMTFLDMESSQDFDAVAQEVDKALGGTPWEGIEEDYDGNKISSLRELYDEIRGDSRDQGWSADDVQSVFDSITHNLMSRGYDGMTHVGGRVFGRDPHSVKIYFNPKSDVKITEVEPSDYNDSPTPPAEPETDRQEKEAAPKRDGDVVSDEEYIKAAETDEKAAQGAVDSVAKKAGYKLLLHGTANWKGNKIDRTMLGRHTGIGRGGLNFTEDEQRAKAYAVPYSKDALDDLALEDSFNPALRETIKSMSQDQLNKFEKDNFYNLEDTELDTGAIDSLDEVKTFISEIADELDKLGVDSASIRESLKAIAETQDPKVMRFYVKGAESFEHPEGGTVWVAKEGADVKLADAVVRDDDGNIIPLSKRFVQSDDIRGDVPKKTVTPPKKQLRELDRQIVSTSEQVVYRTQAEAIKATGATRSMIEGKSGAWTVNQEKLQKREKARERVSASKVSKKPNDSSPKKAPSVSETSKDASKPQPKPKAPTKLTKKQESLYAELQDMDDAQVNEQAKERGIKLFDGGKRKQRDQIEEEILQYQSDTTKPISKMNKDELKSRAGELGVPFDQITSTETLRKKVRQADRGGFIDVSNATRKKGKDEHPFIRQQRENDRRVHAWHKSQTKAFASKIKSEVVDRQADIKKALEENGFGRAIIRLVLRQGSSAEAARQFRIAEKKMKKVLPKQNQTLLKDYISAMRVVEATKVQADKGIELKSPVEAEQAKKWLNDEFNNLPKDQRDSVMEAAQTYWAVMREQLAALKTEGLIGKEGYDSIIENHKFYSPRRFVDFIDPSTANPNGERTHDSGVKALGKGSESALAQDPMYLMAHVITRTQSRIFQNKANKALYDLAENGSDMVRKLKRFETKNKKTGKSTFRYEPSKRDEGMVKVFIDGVETRMAMDGKLAAEWNGLPPALSMEMAQFLQWASGTKILKALATGANPEFAISNLPRDAFYAWFTSGQYSKVLPKALVELGLDYARVTKDAVTKTGAYNEYIKEGGGMDFLTTQGATRKQHVEGGHKFVRQIGDILAWAGETSEIATRLAVRNRAMRNGLDSESATFEARNMLDFSQGGTFTKAADNAIPYLNAAVQGTRGGFRAFKKDPAGTSFKAAQLASIGYGMAYAIASMFPDLWDSLSDREKATKWIIPLPWKETDKNGNTKHAYLAIPKDQFQQLFAAVGQSMADGQSGRPWGPQIINSLKSISPVDATTLPPIGAASIAYFGNYDTWTQEKVWKGYEDISASKEKTWSTPEVASDVTDLAAKMKIEISPERLSTATSKIVPSSNPIGGLFSSMYTIMQNDESNVIGETTVEKVKGTPGLRRMLRFSQPNNVQPYTTEKADRLDVDTDGMTDLEARRAVKKAATEQADVRQPMNVALDKFMASTENLTGGKVRVWLRKNADGKDERQRLWQRAKGKYPEKVKGSYSSNKSPRTGPPTERAPRQPR